MPSFRFAYPGRTFGWPHHLRNLDFHLATGDDSQWATSGDYRPAIAASRPVQMVKRRWQTTPPVPTSRGSHETQRVHGQPRQLHG